MMKTILIFTITIPIAFVISSHLIGQVGGIAAGLAAVAVGLQISERLTHSRGVRGHWLRHRSIYLELGLVMLGMGLGSLLEGGMLGFSVGLCSGALAGLWLNERWGWSGSDVQKAMEVRYGYVAVLVSAAHADGVVTPSEADQITSVARNLFGHLGYGDEADVAKFVADLSANPFSAEAIARYMVGMNPQEREMIQCEALRIVYADGEPSIQNWDWLTRCVRELGQGEWPVLRFFDRSAARIDDSHRAWLAELGLGEDAKPAAIRAAYLAGAQAFHPDRLGGAPTQLRALAEAKMAALNQAYHRLTDSCPAGGDQLHFQHAEEARSFQPDSGQEFHYRCWICGQIGRVPAHAAVRSWRCGSCHALSGLTFDPTAA